MYAVVVGGSIKIPLKDGGTLTVTNPTNHEVKVALRLDGRFRVTSHGSEKPHIELVRRPLPYVDPYSGQLVRNSIDDPTPVCTCSCHGSRR